jgi:hypothetical protein
LPDQFVVQRRIVVEPHQVCGNLNVEVRSQRPSVSEHLCRFSHSLSALLNHRGTTLHVKPDRGSQIAHSATESRAA